MVKGHFNGQKLQGKHTTVTGGGERLLNALASKNWLVSARPGIIEFPNNRGSKSLTIKCLHEDNVHKNTLILRIRTNASVQNIFVEVKDADFKTAISDIKSAARKKMKGSNIFDKTN
jgi:hypothetical protein